MILALRLLTNPFGNRTSSELCGAQASFPLQLDFSRFIIFRPLISSTAILKGGTGH
jgi:hypothetical protein